MALITKIKRDIGRKCYFSYPLAFGAHVRVISDPYKKLIGILPYRLVGKN